MLFLICKQSYVGGLDANFEAGYGFFFNKNYSQKVYIFIMINDIITATVKWGLDH